MRKIIPAILFSSIWMMILAFSGCMNEKKILRYYESHPRLLAKVCGEEYPGTNLEKDSIFYKQGNTSFAPADTLNINIDAFIDSFLKTQHDSTKKALQDSLAAYPIQPIYIHIPCPPASGRVDTVFSYHYEQVSNRAMETYLQYQRDSIASELIKSKTLCSTWQAKAEKRGKTILALFGLLGLFVVALIIGDYFKARIKFPV